MIYASRESYSALSEKTAESKRETRPEPTESGGDAGNKRKWETLQHNGIFFPPPYESKGIVIKIRGETVPLNLLQEEMVYQWAKKKDTPYARDRTFQRNFTADFAATFNTRMRGLKYAEIDFEDAYKLVDIEKDRKAMMTQEERKALAAERKQIKEDLKEAYGRAVLDGETVDLANYMAEPPGIFIGRGAHPLRGRWKRRVGPADVTLNMGEDAVVPPGKWGKIHHNHKATWLASWVDDLTQKTKYIWLADTVGLRQKNDKAKYEKAENLSRKIRKIKKSMMDDMGGSDERKARVATVCYMIYRTAMRVGDEKDEDEADTVGATTLRKEHVKITEDAIHFDFLGKDSIRWQETIHVTDREEHFRINLARQIEEKEPGQMIFDGINSKSVNDYYTAIVTGVTAKVFRTYLASRVAAEYLRKHDDIGESSQFEKIYHAKMANLQAAIKCNHRRTIPKTFQKSLAKKRDTLKKARSKVVKTDKQKQRKKERVEKLKLQIDLARKTKDYNMGTSLRNYIDPRLFKAWTDEVGAEWEKIYTAALQRKFLWVRSEQTSWKAISTRY